MDNKIAWDDLRIVLAIAETGSLSGARRRLGVSHATVFRRLDDIERRLCVKLFNRARTGYTPTPAGEDIATVAANIEDEVLGVERRIAGQDLRPSGTVRVTTTDTLLMGLLSPIFANFRESHPEIFLEIAVSNHLFSLSKREADVAIRPTLAPPETLVGRKIGTIAQAVYRRSDLFPSSENALDIGAADWVGPDEHLAYRPLDTWMEAHGVDECCRYRVDTLMGMLAAVRDGIGLAVLPCYLCDSDTRLTRIGDTIPELSTDLWLLTHPDLRRVARIRAFLDFITQSVKEMNVRLLGTE